MRPKVVRALSLILCLCLSYLQPAPSDGQATVRTIYGTNVENPGYYAATDGGYVDVLRKAGGWSGGSAGIPGFTTNGYPTGGSASSYFTFMGYKPGPKVFNFYGEGICDVSFNGNFTRGIVPNSLKKTVNSDGITVTTCQVNVNVPATTLGGFNLAQGIPLDWVSISNINPQHLANGYPNNFHLTAPDYPAWQPGGNNPIFTDEYLNSLRPFCCLRFMDWQNTNNNINPFSWSDRPQLGYYGSSNGTSGGFYEDMIALCNQLNCDMWICVPLQASTDWKTNFATLVKQNLNPGLHCRYEHGNELWNWGFQAWQIVHQQALADGLTSSWKDHGKRMGHYLMDDASAMQGILGATGLPILAGQWVVQDYCQGGLEYINDNVGPPNQYIYAIAGAPYVGLSSADPSPVSSADVLASMNDYLNGDILTCLKINVALAQKYGVKLCCYECGQSLPSQPEDTFNQMFTAQQDPGMATLYYNWAAMMQAYNVELCEFFTNTGVWSKFGFWGALPLGAQINKPTVRWIAEANLANAANGRIGGGGGGGNNTGGGGTGFGGGFGKHAQMPPSHGGRMMPIKPIKGWPIKSKQMPINGHPWRQLPKMPNK